MGAIQNSLNNLFQSALGAAFGVVHSPGIADTIAEAKANAKLNKDIKFAEEQAAAAQTTSDLARDAMKSTDEQNLIQIYGSKEDALKAQEGLEIEAARANIGRLEANEAQLEFQRDRGKVTPKDYAQRSKIIQGRRDVYSRQIEAIQARRQARDAVPEREKILRDYPNLYASGFRTKEDSK